MFITKREKAESEAQRGKPKSARAETQKEILERIRLGQCFAAQQHRRITSASIHHHIHIQVEGTCYRTLFVRY